MSFEVQRTARGACLLLWACRGGERLCGHKLPACSRIPIRLNALHLPDVQNKSDQVATGKNADESAFLYDGYAADLLLAEYGGGLIQRCLGGQDSYVLCHVVANSTVFDVIGVDEIDDVEFADHS